MERRGGPTHMKPVRTRSLRFQLGATFLLVGLAPAALFGLVALATTASALRASAEARNVALARSVAAEAGRLLDSHLRHLREVALSYSLHPELVRDSSLLVQHFAADPALRSLAILDGQDRVLAAVPIAPDLVGADLSTTPFVRAARERHAPTWSAAAVPAPTGQPSVALVVPGRRGSVVGFLDLDEVARIVGRHGGDGAAIAAVVDGDGAFVARSGAPLLRSALGADARRLVAEVAGGPERTARLPLEGRTWLASAVAIPATGWVALVMEPTEAAYASADRLRLLLLATFAGTTALALGAGYLSARRILRPVLALAASARRLAEGRPPAPADTPPPAVEELEELGRSFEAMAAAVRAREAALARSERSYRRIVDTPAVGVARSAPDGTILFANDALARLAGAERGKALEGTNAGALYAEPEEGGRLLAELEAVGRIVNRELRTRTLGGEERIALLNAVKDEEDYTSILVDVTERRRATAEKERLEQQLMHAQKLEAVGRLAGGVAHDFNNMLTAIMGYANVLREDLPPGAGVREAVDGIMGAAERAANLTRSLLAYSRKQLLARRPVDLRTVLSDATRLIGRVLGEDVRLELRLPDQPLRVLADTGQLDQVLMNLCANARDAMPKGGVLTVSAERVAFDDAVARGHGLAAGGDYVRLRTRDTGVGMSRALLERAFEPFFTTKAVGKGTGLGLAIVHGIVLQHDGAVAIDSVEGEGTTVTVLLPMIGPEAPGPGADGADPDLGPRGSETLLLAEDEPVFRKVVRRILERGGYTVVEASDGREAVEAFAANRARIALCILDVVMPELNGRDALAAIRRIDPRARALFTSGYADDVLDARAPGAPGPILPKPVMPSELLRRVRQALDEG